MHVGGQRFRDHGDADALCLGDYHLPKDIGWSLVGETVDDEGLAALLAPFRPHRYQGAAAGRVRLAYDALTARGCHRAPTWPIDCRFRRMMFARNEGG